MKKNKHTILYCVLERTFVIPFCYGSGTVINYGSGSDFLTSYGSGSKRQKVTVPTVPVPVPQHCFRDCGKTASLGLPTRLSLWKDVETSGKTCGKSNGGRPMTSQVLPLDTARTWPIALKRLWQKNFWGFNGTFSLIVEAKLGLGDAVSREVVENVVLFSVLS